MEPCARQHLPTKFISERILRPIHTVVKSPRTRAYLYFTIFIHIVYAIRGEVWACEARTRGAKIEHVNCSGCWKRADVQRLLETRGRAAVAGNVRTHTPQGNAQVFWTCALIKAMHKGLNARTRATLFCVEHN